MSTLDDNTNIIRRTNKYAKAVAAQYILLNSKKPKAEALKDARIELHKQRAKLFGAINAQKSPALTFAVGDVVKPTDAFLARTAQASVAMQMHKWPTFGFIITSSEMTEDGILNYVVNRIWPVTPSEWELVYRATPESITALYPHPIVVEPEKVPTPAMHVDAKPTPPVKPICYGCSYYSTKATGTYKCHVKGTCPAMEPGFEKVILLKARRK